MTMVDEFARIRPAHLPCPDRRFQGLSPRRAISDVDRRPALAASVGARRPTRRLGGVVVRGGIGPPAAFASTTSSPRVTEMRPAWASSAATRRMSGNQRPPGPGCTGDRPCHFGGAHRRILRAGRDHSLDGCTDGWQAHPGGRSASVSRRRPRRRRVENSVPCMNRQRATSALAHRRVRKRQPDRRHFLSGQGTAGSAAAEVPATETMRARHPWRPLLQANGRHGGRGLHPASLHWLAKPSPASRRGPARASKDNHVARPESSQVREHAKPRNHGHGGGAGASGRAPCAVRARQGGRRQAATPRAASRRLPAMLSNVRFAATRRGRASSPLRSARRQW